MKKITIPQNVIIVLSHDELDLLVCMCDRAIGFMDEKGYGFTAMAEAHEIHEKLIEINT